VPAHALDMVLVEQMINAHATPDGLSMIAPVDPARQKHHGLTKQQLPTLHMLPLSAQIVVSAITPRVNACALMVLMVLLVRNLNVQTHVMVTECVCQFMIWEDI